MVARWLPLSSRRYGVFMEDSLKEGVQVYKRRVRKSISKKQESKTLYGRYIYKQILDEISIDIKKMVSEKNHKARVCGAEWQQMVAVKPLLVAHIALTTILDSLSTPCKRTKLASSIGHKLLDELNFIHLKLTYPKWWTRMDFYKKRRVSYKNRRTYVVRQAVKAHGTKWKLEMPLSSIIRLGLALTELFRQRTNLIEYGKQRCGRHKFQFMVMPTKHALALIDKINSKGEVLNPFYLPLEVVPTKWESLLEGGYKFPPEVNWSFIKGNRKADITANYDKAFQAANVLQATAYRINPRVLEVSRTLVRREKEVVDEGLQANRKALKGTDCTLEYRRCQAKYHEARIEQLPKMILNDNILTMGERFLGKKFYMPVQSDFRGRLYYAPRYLNPQGTDLAKGLLQFAKPTAIRDCEHWFLIGGANSFGIKGSLEERQEWALAHEREIKKAADDPLGSLWWREASSPYPFLAWCFEFVSWMSNRFSFKTLLPVRLDHHASGLQIVACLTEDEELMRLTNLADLEKPNDIYATILNKLSANLKVSHRPEDYHWLSLGINRELIKELTVCFMYGSSYFGLEHVLKKWYMTLEVDVFKREFYKESRKLIENFYTALDQVSPIPAMFLRETRDLQKDEPLSLDAPSGFRVTNDYKKQRSIRVKTTVNNELVVSRVNEPTRAFDQRAARRALPANMVHAYDAALLHTVLTTTEWPRIQTLHDCYAIPPMDCDKCMSVIKNSMSSVFGVDLPEKMCYAAS